MHPSSNRVCQEREIASTAVALILQMAVHPLGLGLCGAALEQDVKQPEGGAESQSEDQGRDGHWDFASGGEADQKQDHSHSFDE